MTKPSNAKQTYVPGVCNINNYQAGQRRQIGLLGVAVTLVVMFVGFANQWPGQLLGLAVYVPLFVSMLGFYQSKQNFCIEFGLRGKYSTDEGPAAADVPKTDRSKNQKQATRIILQSALAALIASVFIALIA